VLGGGITGLATAMTLTQAGVSVAAVEAGRVACGVTGYTTAKVTSLHGLTYAKLPRTFGAQGARVYGEANQPPGRRGNRQPIHRLSAPRRWQASGSSLR
jgi:glycine/D-amino acid oxidase-like deaminating enzyme